MLTQLDHPLTRLQELGPRSLATSELLTLLLRFSTPKHSAHQVAERLVAQYHTLGALANAPLYELAEVEGMSDARAAQLLAAIELGIRIGRERELTQRAQITSPADAARLLMPEMCLLEQEHLRVILLDTRNRVIAIHEVYKGSLNVSMIRVAEIFREAIRRNAAAIIVAHNHPSGDASPSPEDQRVTVELVETGKLLDIDMLDHLVIGRNYFVSMKERGLGFSGAK